VIVQRAAVIWLKKHDPVINENINESKKMMMETPNAIWRISGSEMNMKTAYPRATSQLMIIPYKLNNM
jgi:hypothetical protein